MSDTPAQPTTGLAHRLVGDPNSAIGSLIKRGFTGVTSAVPQPFDTVVPAEKPTAQQPSTGDALTALETVLDEVENEGVMPQVASQVMTQTADALDPALTVPVSPTSARKETAEPVTIDQVAVEAARGVQQVETEPAAEIPPEVESYLQQVEDHAATAPKEIVIADGSQTAPADHQYPAQPVVVLPITAEEEKAGAKKSPKFSIRWLVEWSQRLMKIFVGKIIYRSTTESTPNAA